MQNQNQASKRYVRTKDAAYYVGLSKSTLEKMRLTGGGPEYSALGRVIVYQVADLDLWIASKKCRSTSDYPR